MDVNGLTQSAVAWRSSLGRVLGFNSLVGKGPRGTLWIWRLACSRGRRCCRSCSAIRTICRSSRDTIDYLGISGVRRQLALRRRFSTSSSGEQVASDTPLRNCSSSAGLWGLAIGINFFALLFQGVIHSRVVVALLRRAPDRNHRTQRYSSWGSRRGAAVAGYRGPVSVAPRHVLIGPIPAGGNTVADCDDCLLNGSKRPAIRESFIVRRLHDALDFVRRKNSADDLEPHLRHLEEVESVRVNRHTRWCGSSSGRFRFWVCSARSSASRWPLRI